MNDDEMRDEVTNKAIRTILEECEAQRRRRAELMPDEQAAIGMLYEAYTRLKELGWKNSMHCPVDGKEYRMLEAGCAAAGVGHREIKRCGNCKAEAGKWFWMHDAGDWWPANPILFKEKEVQK